jgi:hypothetical protein
VALDFSVERFKEFFPMLRETTRQCGLLARALTLEPIDKRTVLQRFGDCLLAVRAIDQRARQRSSEMWIARGELRNAMALADGEKSTPLPKL